MATLQTWIDYWNADDFWKHSPLWKVNAGLFCRRAQSVVGLRHDDLVLNIGSGPGHLEVLLSPMVKEIFALDVSEQFVELCRQNCRNCDNVEVALLGHDYTNLSVCRKKFSLILCVSIVQYYRDTHEIEALITSARQVALPGARMLIADLPIKRKALGFLWDAFGSLTMSIKEGYSPALLQAAYAKYFRRRRYRSLCNDNKVLSFTIKDLESLVKRMRLNATVIRRSLSVYSNRPSILINL